MTILQVPWASYMPALLFRNQKTPGVMRATPSSHYLNLDASLRWHDRGSLTAVFRVIPLVLLLVFLSASCFAETYTLPQYQAPSYLLHNMPKKAEIQPPLPKRIVMYSSNYCNKCEAEETCKPCARAKALFKARGLEYEEYNISESSLYRKQYQRLGGGTLPMIFINGKRMHGFRGGLFDETYKAAPEKPGPYKPARSEP